MNRWVCLRCYESNDDSAPACVKCGLLRGSMPPAEAPGQAAAWSPIASPRGSMLGGLLRRFAWVGVVAVFAIGAVAVNNPDAGVPVEPVIIESIEVKTSS